MDTFEEEVNSVVSQMVQSPEGKWDLPEGLELPEHVRYSANAERRRRDTQAALAKAELRAKSLEVENSELAKGWEADVVRSLTKEQQDDLEELKSTDPDAWRSKMNDYEAANREQFGTRRTEISKKAASETALDKRSRLLEEFQEANPTISLTDDVIENDIPPRFVKKLEKGECTFEEFLESCKNYLTANKVVGDSEAAPQGPNLGKLPGKSVPSDNAVGQDVKASYKKEVY